MDFRADFRENKEEEKKGGTHHTPLVLMLALEKSRRDGFIDTSLGVRPPPPPLLLPRLEWNA